MARRAERSRLPEPRKVEVIPRPSPELVKLYWRDPLAWYQPPRTLWEKFLYAMGWWAPPPFRPGRVEVHEAQEEGRLMPDQVTVAEQAGNVIVSANPLITLKIRIFRAATGQWEDYEGETPSVVIEPVSKG